MKKKKNDRKLTLSKETLTILETRNLAGVGGAVGAVGCQESNRICSIQHTCVSCPSNTVTICQ